MEEISKINAFSASVQALEAAPNEKVNHPPLDFRTVFNESVHEVNGLNTQAQTMVEALATGRTNDTSGVMLAVRKSNMAFLTLLQIRNQVIEAYQEVMRMRM